LAIGTDLNSSSLPQDIPSGQPSETLPAVRAGQDFAWRFTLAAFLLAALLAVFVQWRTGAWRDDFSATGDESSHFTSSVAMSRYLTSGQLMHPYQFASQYYVHYPKLAFGKWPPFFYLLSGIWFLIFSPSRLTAMIFIALESAALAAVAYWVASRLLPPLLALLAALAVVATPFFALHSTIFMLEPQTAALGLLSLMAFLAVLEGVGLWAEAAFIAASCACILTKANGWAVLLSAGIGYLFLRRRAKISLFRLAAVFALVVAICAPFYYVFLHAMSDGNVSGSPSLAFTMAAVPSYLQNSALAVGPAISVLLVAALIAYLLGASRGTGPRPLVVLLLAWAGGAFLFQSVVPASFEIRHLAIAFPCLVLLAFAGVRELCDRFEPRWAPAASVALLLLTIPWTMPARFSDLFQIAAPEVVSDLAKTVNKAVLVSSDGPDEGRMVASMAALDLERRYICIRATKLLVDTDWGADDYRLLVSTPADVLKKLDSVPVGLVLIHDMGRREPYKHDLLLRDALLSAPGQWRVKQVLKGTSPDGTPESLTVFENSANAAKPILSFQVDMRRKLGRVLATQFNDE
jgi:hypothetical protein